ncbi:MAG TPA: LamG-like jellyroll fold domain-containing protein [Verrucomicrobiales bacterium]|nr:LamG-like jellyroll fold domain-containing protein [Verrucomicrobiales bacterium]
MKSGPIGAHAPCIRLLPVWMCFAAAITASGAPIEVNNHSFENATYTGTNSWTNDIIDPATTSTKPQWIGRDGNNSGETFIERIGGFVSAGQAHIGLQNNYFVFQNTGVPWEANKQYILTVGVGNRNAGFSPPGSLSIVGLTNLEAAPSNDNVLTGLNANDRLLNDPLLSGAHAIVDSGLYPTSTFVDVTVEYVTGASPPAGNVVIFLGDDVSENRSHFDNVRLEVFSALDPDGDGLPSDWESEHGLDPESAEGDHGADGDFDGDGLTNLEEFLLGTRPDLADTDGDGLSDGDEVNIYGTDPLNPDTDGDTLEDGAEVASDPPTDPTNRDTDGDGFEDQAEWTAGTNPALDTSFPVSGGGILLGINFVGGRVDGTPGAAVTGTAGVVPQANWNNLEDLGGVFAGGEADPLIDSEGNPLYLRAWWTVDDTFTIEPNAPPNNADENSKLMAGFLRTRTGVLTEVRILNIPFPLYDVYVYHDSDGEDGVSDFTVNGRQVFGVLDQANWPVTGGNGAFVEVTGDGTAGNYLVFRNVSGPTMQLNASNAGVDFRAAVNAVQIVRVEPGDPSLLPDPAIIDFGAYDGNPGTLTEDLRLINTGGTQTLNIASWQITGPAAGLYSVTDLPWALDPNQSQVVQVTFAGSNDTGIHRAVLEISSNDADVSTTRVQLITQINNANGLLVHYKMDETDGDRMLDSSGNGFDGNYLSTGGGSVELGAPSLAGGGSAVRFSDGGSNDGAGYGEIPVDIGLPSLAVSSYAFWFQVDPGDEGTNSILFSRSEGPANPFAVTFAKSANADPLQWISQGGTVSLESGPFIQTGVTHHVVFTIDDRNADGTADMHLYVDGTLMTEALAASAFDPGAAGPFQIGGTAGAFGLSGIVDDFQIYDRVLSAEDAAYLFANPGATALVPEPVPVLIGYWPFDDQMSPTEDASAFDNAGTVNGGATFVAGHSGQAGDFAIQFDGVDDSVTTTAPLLDELEQYTIAGWINFTVAQPARTGLFGQNDLVEFGIDGANLLQCWTAAEGTLAAPAPFGESTGGWVHVATVSGLQNRFLYIDGVQVAQGGVTLPHNTSAFNFNIGGSGIWDADGNWFNGLIDDVAVYDVALTPGEIASLADGSKTPLEIRAPVAPLDDVTQPGDPVVLVNGENDGDANDGPPPETEGVENAINNVGQKYLNFLDLGSGLIVTPTMGGTVVTGLRLYPANDAVERDPASYRLEGSVAGPAGPFTLISEGDLALPDDRNPGGAIAIDTSAFHQEISFPNATAYLSYRLIFPTLKDAATANSMQIAEIEFLGVPGEVIVIPDGDSDGDGVSDASEILAGTDPNDPDSYLKVVTTGHSGAEVTLEWTSVEGKSYDVQYSTTQQPGSWTVINTEPIAGSAAGTSTFQDTDPDRLAEPEGYYRAAIRP